MAMIAPEMRPFSSFLPPGYPMASMGPMGPMAPVMPTYAGGVPGLQDNAFLGQTPLMGTLRGIPQPQQMHPLMHTQQVVPPYMNGHPQAMNMSFLPPMQNSAAAAQMPASGTMPETNFKIGDRVQLKGHAANPSYAGKLYTVEAVDIGTVIVSHKLSERNVSRMTFHKAYLELVTPAEEVPPEPAPEATLFQAQAQAQNQADNMESTQIGDTVRIVGLGPRHNGRMCAVESVDARRRMLRVKFLDSNDMLELGPTYLELVERAKEQPIVTPERQGVQGEGGLHVGDMVRVLAPPQHRGKVAVVEVPNTGDGSLRVRLQDPLGQVNMLVLSPTHVQNMDGTPVAGTAEAVAASQAQVNAARQAAVAPSQALGMPGQGFAAPLAVQPGDRVRVKPSLASQGGKVGIVEMENDGTGCVVVQIQDVTGPVRLRINPVHLDFA